MLIIPRAEGLEFTLFLVAPLLQAFPGFMYCVHIGDTQDFTVEPCVLARAASPICQHTELVAPRLNTLHTRKLCTLEKFLNFQVFSISHLLKMFALLGYSIFCAHVIRYQSPKPVYYADDSHMYAM